MADPTAPSCFDLLDARVVDGHADDVAAPAATGHDWTYARLLEEVAAFGGVLRHCGVAPGTTVAVDLPDGPDDGTDALVVVLACARIGAHHRFGTVEADQGADSVGVVRAGEGARPTVVVAGEPHAWDVLLRAGRTDPAACEAGAVVSPYDARTRALLAPLLRTDRPGWPSGGPRR